MEPLFIRIKEMITIVKLILKILALGLGALLAFLGLLSLYFYITTDAQSFSLEDRLEQRDYVLVLGCGTYQDEPTPMLEKRLEAALSTYKKARAKYIIVSGSVDDDYYDEVEVMKNYLLAQGIEASAIIEDRHGDNTFLSVKNAIKKGYGYSLYIVTQDSHLRRALFLTNCINPGHKALGVKASDIKYKDAMIYMNLREVLARVKALFDVMNVDLSNYL